MIALALAGVVAATPSLPRPILEEVLPRLGPELVLVGTWDNGQQVASEGDNGRPYLHLRHLLATPGEGGIDQPALYAELRVGSADTAPYRQRVYLFEHPDAAEQVRMQVYELADPARFANATQADISNLTMEDLVRFDPDCDFYWTRHDTVWTGAMTDETCLMVSRRSGVEMIINAEFTASLDQFTHSESGRNAQTGEVIFGPPGGIPNIYDPAEEHAHD